MFTNYKLLLFSALLIVISVGSALAQNTSSQARLAPLGSPCAEGVISAETQENVPLQISIEESACDTTQRVSVSFKVKNVSSKVVIKFEIRGLETYEHYFDDGGGIRVSELVLKPNEIYKRGIMSGGNVQTKAGGIPVGKLKTYVLTVWSVTFDDGTKWERAEEVRNSMSNQ